MEICFWLQENDSTISNTNLVSKSFFQTFLTLPRKTYCFIIIINSNTRKCFLNYGLKSIRKIDKGVTEELVFHQKEF